MNENMDGKAAYRGPIRSLAVTNPRERLFGREESPRQHFHMVSMSMVSRERSSWLIIASFLAIVSSCGVSDCWLSISTIR